MRDPRHPRHFTDEFKRQIVDLYNAGKPKREIMDEYDLGKSTVERWIKSINATGSPRAAGNRTPEQNRILELERENRRLRMEVDVPLHALAAHATSKGRYGPRKIKASLEGSGATVSRRRVCRIMGGRTAWSAHTAGRGSRCTPGRSTRPTCPTSSRAASAAGRRAPIYAAT